MEANIEFRHFDLNDTATPVQNTYIYPGLIPQQIKATNCAECMYKAILEEDRIVQNRTGTTQIFAGVLLCHHRGNKNVYVYQNGRICSAFKNEKEEVGKVLRKVQDEQGSQNSL